MCVGWFIHWDSFRIERPLFWKAAAKEINVSLFRDSGNPDLYIFHKRMCFPHSVTALWIAFCGGRGVEMNDEGSTNRTTNQGRSEKNDPSKRVFLYCSWVIIK